MKYPFYMKKPLYLEGEYKYWLYFMQTEYVHIVVIVWVLLSLKKHWML